MEWFLFFDFDHIADVGRLLPCKAVVVSPCPLICWIFPPSSHVEDYRKAAGQTRFRRWNHLWCTIYVYVEDRMESKRNGVLQSTLHARPRTTVHGYVTCQRLLLEVQLLPEVPELQPFFIGHSTIRITMRTVRTTLRRGGSTGWIVSGIQCGLSATQKRKLAMQSQEHARCPSNFWENQICSHTIGEAFGRDSNLVPNQNRATSDAAQLVCWGVWLCTWNSCVYTKVILIFVNNVKKYVKVLVCINVDKFICDESRGVTNLECCSVWIKACFHVSKFSCTASSCYSEFFNSATSVEAPTHHLCHITLKHRY